MGNDGGTILKRLNVAKSVQLKVDDIKRQSRKDNEEAAFDTCALSCQPLYKNPIVSDYKGKLYLKEKLLEYLLARAKSKKALLTQEQIPVSVVDVNDMSHIKGLQDVVDLRIAWDPISHHLQCPVTGATSKSLSYLRPCGCVVSNSFLNSIGGNEPSSQDRACPICQTPYNIDYDIVHLNPMGDPKLTQTNTRSYTRLQSLGLSHAKRSLVRKSKKRTKSIAGDPTNIECSSTNKRRNSQATPSTTKKQKV